MEPRRTTNLVQLESLRQVSIRCVRARCQWTKTRSSNVATRARWVLQCRRVLARWKETAGPALPVELESVRACAGRKHRRGSQFDTTRRGCAIPESQMVAGRQGCLCPDRQPRRFLEPGQN